MPLFFCELPLASSSSKVGLELWPHATVQPQTKAEPLFQMAVLVPPGVLSTVLVIVNLKFVSSTDA